MTDNSIIELVEEDAGIAGDRLQAWFDVQPNDFVGSIYPKKGRFRTERTINITNKGGLIDGNDGTLVVDTSRTISNIATATGIITVSGGDTEVQFDPSGVNSGTDTITITGHGKLTGDSVMFRVVSGSMIGGISAFTRYYVYKVDDDHIRLYTTSLRANRNDIDIGGYTPINVTAGAGMTAIFSRGFSNNQLVYLDHALGKAGLPPELYRYKKYYIIPLTNETFKLSETSGGGTPLNSYTNSGTAGISIFAETPTAIKWDASTTAAAGDDDTTNRWERVSDVSSNSDYTWNIDGGERTVWKLFFNTSNEYQYYPRGTLVRVVSNNALPNGSGQVEALTREVLMQIPEDNAILLAARMGVFTTSVRIVKYKPYDAHPKNFHVEYVKAQSLASDVDTQAWDIRALRNFQRDHLNVSNSPSAAFFCQGVGRQNVMEGTGENLCDSTYDTRFGLRPFTVTNLTSNECTLVGHEFQDGMDIYVAAGSGVLPLGLSNNGTKYVAKRVSDDVFIFRNSTNTADIDLTGTGTPGFFVFDRLTYAFGYWKSDTGGRGDRVTGGAGYMLRHIGDTRLYAGAANADPAHLGGNNATLVTNMTGSGGASGLIGSHSGTFGNGMFNHAFADNLGYTINVRGIDFAGNIVDVNNQWVGAVFSGYGPAPTLLYSGGLHIKTGYFLVQDGGRAIYANQLHYLTQDGDTNTTQVRIRAGSSIHLSNVELVTGQKTSGGVITATEHNVRISARDLRIRTEGTVNGISTPITNTCRMLTVANSTTLGSSAIDFTDEPIFDAFGASVNNRTGSGTYTTNIYGTVWLAPGAGLNGSTNAVGEDLRARNLVNGVAFKKTAHVTECTPTSAVPGYQMLRNDQTLLVFADSTGVFSPNITLPIPLPLMERITIKDAAGNAATNNHMHTGPNITAITYSTASGTVGTGDVFLGGTSGARGILHSRVNAVQIAYNTGSGAGTFTTGQLVESASGAQGIYIFRSGTTTGTINISMLPGSKPFVATDVITTNPAGGTVTATGGPSNQTAYGRLYLNMIQGSTFSASDALTVENKVATFTATSAPVSHQIKIDGATTSSETTNFYSRDYVYSSNRLAYYKV